MPSSWPGLLKAVWRHFLQFYSKNQLRRPTLKTLIQHCHERAGYDFRSTGRANDKKSAPQTNSKPVLKLKILPDCLQVPNGPAAAFAFAMAAGSSAGIGGGAALPGSLKAVWLVFSRLEKSAPQTNSKSQFSVVDFQNLLVLLASSKA